MGWFSKTQETSSGLLVRVAPSGALGRKTLLGRFLKTKVPYSGLLVRKTRTRLWHEARKTQRSLPSNTLKRALPIQHCLSATRSPCGTLSQQKSPRINPGSQNLYPVLILLEYLTQRQLIPSTTFHHVPERVPDTHHPPERPLQTRTETAALMIDNYTFSSKKSQALPPNRQHRTTAYIDLLFRIISSVKIYDQFRKVIRTVHDFFCWCRTCKGASRRRLCTVPRQSML